ncbi:unnamed protein product [Closterium sp. NIES-53]
MASSCFTLTWYPERIPRRFLIIYISKEILGPIPRYCFLPSRFYLFFSHDFLPFLPTIVDPPSAVAPDPILSSRASRAVALVARAPPPPLFPSRAACTTIARPSFPLPLASRPSPKRPSSHLVARGLCTIRPFTLLLLSSLPSFPSPSLSLSSASHLSPTASAGYWLCFVALLIESYPSTPSASSPSSSPLSLHPLLISLSPPPLSSPQLLLLVAGLASSSCSFPTLFLHL